MKTTNPLVYPQPPLWHPHSAEVTFPGTRFPDVGGLTLRDAAALAERLTDIDHPQASAPPIEVCEALAGMPRPSYDHGTTLNHYRFEAAWRAGLRYLRADAMLAARMRIGGAS